MRNQKEISKRAQSWDKPINLGGVWIDGLDQCGNVVLKAKTDTGLDVKTALSETQARALVTLIETTLSSKGAK